MVRACDLLSRPLPAVKKDLVSEVLVGILTEKNPDVRVKVQALGNDLTTLTDDVNVEAKIREQRPHLHDVLRQHYRRAKGQAPVILPQDSKRVTRLNRSSKRRSKEADLSGEPRPSPGAKCDQWAQHSLKREDTEAQRLLLPSVLAFGEPTDSDEDALREELQKALGQAISMDICSKQLQKVEVAVRRLKEAPNGTKATVINLVQLVYVRVYESNNQRRLQLMEELLEACLGCMRRGEMTVDSAEEAMLVINALVRLAMSFELTVTPLVIDWLRLMTPERARAALMGLIGAAEGVGQLGGVLKSVSVMANAIREVVRFEAMDLLQLRQLLPSNPAAVQELLSEVYHGPDHARLRMNAELAAAMLPLQAIDPKPAMVDPRPSLEDSLSKPPLKSIFDKANEFLAADPELFKPDRVDYNNPFDVTPLIKTAVDLSNQTGLLSNPRFTFGPSLIERCVYYFVDLHLLRTSDVRFLLNDAPEPAVTIVKCFQNVLRDFLGFNLPETTVGVFLDIVRRHSMDPEPTLFQKRVVDVVQRLLKKWASELQAHAKTVDFKRVLRTLAGAWGSHGQSPNGDVMEFVGRVVTQLALVAPERVRAALEADPWEPMFERYCVHKMAEAVDKVNRGQLKAAGLTDSAPGKMSPDRLSPKVEGHGHPKGLQAETRAGRRKSRAVDPGSPGRAAAANLAKLPTPPRLESDLTQLKSPSNLYRVNLIDSQGDKDSYVDKNNQQIVANVVSLQGSDRMKPIVGGFGQSPLMPGQTSGLPMQDPPRDPGVDSKGNALPSTTYRGQLNIVYHPQPVITSDHKRQSSYRRASAWREPPPVVEAPPPERHFKNPGVQELMDMLQRGQFTLGDLEQKMEDKK